MFSCSPIVRSPGIPNLRRPPLTRLPPALAPPATAPRATTSIDLPVADGELFQHFFRWLFEMGKAIGALGSSAHISSVRSVPLAEGLSLADAVLSTWHLLPQLRVFLTHKFNQPFTKECAPPSPRPRRPPRPRRAPRGT